MTSDCKLHNTVVTYDELQSVKLFRNDFIDQSLKKTVSKQIKANQPVYFLPNSVYETHIGPQYNKIFKLYMMGILADGRKALVILDGIRPYFYVRVHPEYRDKPNDYKDILTRVLKNATEQEKESKREWLNAKMIPVDTEVVYLKRLKEYEPTQVPYIKLIYDNNENRVRAIKKLKDVPDRNGNKGAIILGHDDVSYYHRVFSRDNNIPLSKWATLNNYEFSNEQLSEFMMTSLYEDFQEETIFTLNYSNYKMLPKEHIEYEELKDDRSMVCAWDTEVYSSTGILPDPKVEKDELMTISLVFFQNYSKTPFLKVAISMFPTNAHPDYFTIICGTEKKMLMAYAEIMNRLKPDFIEGFNDMQFDTPWIYERAHQFHPGVLTYLYFHTSCMIVDYIHSSYVNIYNSSEINTANLIEFGSCNMLKTKTNTKVDDYISTHIYMEKKLKLEAGRDHEGHIWNVPGLINLDVRPIFMQIYPTAEQSSLNFYLAENKLPPKNDMQIHVIFTSYKEAKSMPKTKSGYAYAKTNDPEQVRIYTENMDKITMYCVIDSQRSRELMQQRLILQEKREFANLTWVSLFDSIYFANGAKVINVVAGYCERMFNLTFSNSYNDERLSEKFSGAFVDNPIKGVYVSNLSALECKVKYNLSNFTEEQIKWVQNYVKQNDICNFHVDAHNLKASMLNGITDEKELETKTLEYNIELKRQTTEMESKVEAMNTEYRSKFKYDIPGEVLQEMKKVMKRPIGGLDFASLYPSIMRAYNLSPEKCLTVFSVKDRVPCNHLINDPEKLRQANEALDALAAKYNADPKLKSKFVKRPIIYAGKEINAYFQWHDNKITYGDPDFAFGVFPYILNLLFDFRLIFKTKLKIIKEQIEEGGQALTPEQIAAGKKPISTQEMDELKKSEKFYNSKQNAVKLLMNCFYGATGQQGSPINILELAANVTNMAQHAIKYARKVVYSTGCKIYYGDTDSIYLSVAEEVFHYIDILYYSGQLSKRDYWYLCVAFSFEQVKIVKKRVDTELAKMSNTKFLSMDYEEFLWPCIMCAKKKYVGREHIKSIDFEKNKVFVRGLEFRKRGASDLLKELSNWVIETILSPENVHDMLSLIQQAIDSIYNKPRPIKCFAKSANYRPKKKNVAVNEFAMRMLKQDTKMIENDRFMYVVCETYPWKFDERGCQVDIKKSDRMELLHIAETEGKEIDRSYYIEGEISGALGVFITYHPEFHVEPENGTDEAYKKAEQTIRKNAKKWVIEYGSKYFKSYKNNGTVLKSVYKKVSGMIKSGISDDFSNLYAIISKKCNVDNLMIEINQIADVKARHSIGVEKEDYRYGIEFLREFKAYELNAATFLAMIDEIDKVKKDPKSLGLTKGNFKHICEVYKIIESLDEHLLKVKHKIDRILENIKSCIDDIKGFFNSYNVLINQLVMEYKAKMEIVDETKDLEEILAKSTVDEDKILDKLQRKADKEFEAIKSSKEAQNSYDVFNAYFDKLIRYKRILYKISNVSEAIKHYNAAYKNIPDAEKVKEMIQDHKKLLMEELGM